MAVLSLLVGGCGNSVPPSLDLPIFFTCDTRGRLEPCGCFAGQFGGLSRLKTVLDVAATTNALCVDVGDAAGGRADYDWIEYRQVLQVFAATHYDALNVGGREAQFSAAQLRELRQTSPVPIISANLFDRANQRPLFDAYRIVQRGAFRIGILGVLDPRAVAGQPGDGLAVGDMESAIDRGLAAMRGQTDLIVLLAFTDEATLAQLAQHYFECQVILGGNVSQPAPELQHQNRSLVYFVTNESRALGMLQLRLTVSAPLQVLGNEIRLLHDKIPQDAGVRELMQQYREEIRHTHLEADDPGHLEADRVPGVRMAAAYVGSDACLSCHPAAAKVWQASAHARAFATLLDHKADADPHCIPCHTVGFGSPSGYRREFGAARLTNAGCESCHGPGSLHVRQKSGDASVNFTFRPLDAGDCRKCHQGEFSRPFNWDEFWPLIRHGKEPVAR